MTKKNISIADWKKASGNINNVDIVEWNGLQIEVKGNLSFTEVVEFVEGVVAGCFSTETEEYVPEAKEFAIRTFVLMKYAGFNMPKNLDERYELIYGTDLFPTVVDHINGEQLLDIRDSIDEKINLITSQNVAAVTKQIDGIAERFDRLITDLESIFADISSDEVKGVVEALSAIKDKENDIVAKAVTNIARIKKAAK